MTKVQKAEVLAEVDGWRLLRAENGGKYFAPPADNPDADPADCPAALLLAAMDKKEKK